MTDSDVPLYPFAGGDPGPNSSYPNAGGTPSATPLYPYAGGDPGPNASYPNAPASDEPHKTKEEGETKDQ